MRVLQQTANKVSLPSNKMIDETTDEEWEREGEEGEEQEVVLPTDESAPETDESCKSEELLAERTDGKGGKLSVGSSGRGGGVWRVRVDTAYTVRHTTHTPIR